MSRPMPSKGRALLPSLPWPMSLAISAEIVDSLRLPKRYLRRSPATAAARCNDEVTAAVSISQLAKSGNPASWT